MIDGETANLIVFAIQGRRTGHDNKLKRVNTILGTRIFRGYWLNMMD